MDLLLLHFILTFIYGFFLCLSAGASANIGKAQDPKLLSVSNNPERIEVVGVRKRLYEKGLLKDSIVKTELISEQQIKATQAANLSEAISNSIGIRVSNECSMCGAKRVMINGLKGEHTNVLVDGIPLHTMLSGFYGLDAVAMSGIGKIEVARGAGASLIAPEAIGGTINLVTQTPTESGGELDASLGNLGYRKFAFMGSVVPKEHGISTSMIVQLDERKQYDGDNNGVSESPQLENQSFTTLLSYDFDRDTDIRIRFNHTKSEVFGGPILGDDSGTIKDVLASVSLGEAPALFAQGHVNDRYIGHPWETAEWVKTQRNEVLGSVLREFGSSFNGILSVARVNHKQVSFYEGVDYDAKDNMDYVDLRLNWDFNSDHLMTFGVDYRNEQMRSHSRALATLNNYVSDSFDYLVQGIYLQDSWTVNTWLEVSTAMRLDHVKADFVDPMKVGIEIDKTLLSPRVDSRVFHSEELTSRLSIGQGYRAPLSFFESDHGILDAQKGYLIDVSQLERSKSISYSLNFENETWINTASIAYTQVKGLASLESNDAGIPVLSQLIQTASVLAIDFALSYQLNKMFNIALSAEAYKYNDPFRASFAIAPIEKRGTVSFNWQYIHHTLDLTLVYVTSRNLKDYNYFGYNDVKNKKLKPTDVPAFSTVDFKYQFNWTRELTLYIGANNVLNYSQARTGSSPLLFDAEGGYDVTYIYAPMRGRMVYAGFDWDF